MHMAGSTLHDHAKFRKEKLQLNLTPNVITKFRPTWK